jgi:hypothetical protein
VNRIKPPSIDIEILMRRVRLGVMNATAGKQSSVEQFIPGRAWLSSRPDVGPDESVPAQAQPDISAASDLEFWQSIKDTSDAAMYRTYLAAFPNGAFTEIAKSRLVKLEISRPAEKSPPKNHNTKSAAESEGLATAWQRHDRDDFG